MGTSVLSRLSQDKEDQEKVMIATNFKAFVGANTRISSGVASSRALKISTHIYSSSIYMMLSCVTQDDIQTVLLSGA